jgi:AAA domain
MTASAPLLNVVGAQAVARSGRTGDVDGAAFALNAPAEIEAVWGVDSRVLWAEGEPTMLYGPDGVGKTTIAQQLVLARVGVNSRQLLGLPVAPARDKVLYLALDRPKQAARSMRRMVAEADRLILAEGLHVWRGSLPIDVINNPDGLAAFALDREADTVVIDSVKDLAPNLSDESVGMALHQAWQACVEAGVEVLALHHPRKAQADNKKPKTLADVYGSRWLTAGCGSVLLVWGDAGDPVVSLEHLKQPADAVGPLKLLHDNRAGTTTLIDALDVVQIIATRPDAASVKDIATVLFRTTDPDRNAIEKTRRKLEAAADDNRLTRMPAAAGEPVLYRLPNQGVTQRVTEGHA